MHKNLAAGPILRTIEPGVVPPHPPDVCVDHSPDLASNRGGRSVTDCSAFRQERVGQRGGETHAVSPNRAVADAIARELDIIDAQMSTWRPDSTITRFVPRRRLGR